MTDYTELDFDVGEWSAPEVDLQALTNNLDLVRMRFKSSIPVNEDTVVRGMVWVNAASSTWAININDGNNWIELFSINTITEEVVYPGGYIAGDSIADGAIDTYHVKDGELDARTIAPAALRNHHVASGTLQRYHVSSGAVNAADLQTAVFQNKHFGTSVVSEDKIKVKTRSDGGSYKDYDWESFSFGMPDIRGNGAWLYGKTSNCSFRASQTAKSGFKLKSSSTTTMKVDYYEQYSS